MRFILSVVLLSLSLAMISSIVNWEFQNQIDSQIIDNKVSPNSLEVRWDIEGKFYDVPCFVDNINAKDCTYEDLLIFLKEDLTDKMVLQENDVLNSCERYTLVLHDNAEKFGIRCGYAIVTFVEIDEVYGRFGHALCAFNTLDRGIIFIDDTFSPNVDVDRDSMFDKTGEVVVGQKYAPNRLFDDRKYKTMGTVESVDVYWREPK